MRGEFARQAATLSAGRFEHKKKVQLCQGLATCGPDNLYNYLSVTCPIICRGMAEMFFGDLPSCLFLSVVGWGWWWPRCRCTSRNAHVCPEGIVQSLRGPNRQVRSHLAPDCSFALSAQTCLAAGLVVSDADRSTRVVRGK